jgi:hypothetical protein
MLLIKERVFYPSDDKTEYNYRFNTNQPPELATRQYQTDMQNRSPLPPQPTPQSRTVVEPLVYGDEVSEGERALAFRPTGQRKYKEGEPIRQVDTRGFLSPGRALQELRESKALGEGASQRSAVLRDPKTGVGLASADLPDEEGRKRTKRLQHAFKNQQRFLERLSREGKTIPEGFGEFSGLHPSALLSRLRDNPQAFLFAGKLGEGIGEQRIPVKRPVFGPGGQLERISARHGKDGYKRFKDNPLESFLTGVQGSKLNPANWGSPGTMEYKTRRAQNEALKARMALLMETEKRKIANPEYQSPSNVKTQNAAFIRDLVSNEASPEARAMLNVLARDPTMRELNERIKAEGRDKRVAEGRERREKQKEFRFDNPKYLRYGELGEYLKNRDDLPFKTTGANQQVILGRWQEVANLLERGLSPNQVQQILPSEYFLGNKKAKGKGKKAEDKKVEEEQAAEEQVDEEEQVDDKEPDIAEEYQGLPENVGFTVGGQPRIRDLNSTIREMGGTPEGTREEKIEQLRYLMNNEPVDTGGQTEEDAEPVSEELSEQEEEEIADREANKKAAREERIATNRKQMTGVFGAMTSGKNPASTDDTQEFMAFASDDPNMKMQRQGGFHLTTPDKKTLKFGVATSRAIASGSGKYKIDEQSNKNRAQNEVLKDALTKTGVWDTLKPEVRTNVSTGSDLSHWGNIFRELTGAELSEYGVTAGKDDDPDMFLSDDPVEPIDLAWAILKGL